MRTAAPAPPGKKSRQCPAASCRRQIGFAFALLVAQDCFLASFRLLLQVDPGFNPNGVVTASVGLPASKYPGNELMRVFMKRALPAVRRHPRSFPSPAQPRRFPLAAITTTVLISPKANSMKSGESRFLR